jgi:hypothetical protein
MSYIPTMAEIWQVAQSRGQDSDAPHLWRGLVGAWPFQEGGGTWVWDVSNRQHGTMVNMAPATAWRVSENRRSLNFNGINTYLSVPSISGFSALSGWTVSLRVLARSYSQGWPRLIAYVQNTLKWIVALGTNIAWAAYNDGAEYRTSSPNNAINLMQWAHLAATYQNGSVRLYINGASQSHVPIEEVFWGNNGFWIGARPTGGNIQQVHDGLATTIAVHQRILTNSEISQLYADPWAMYRLRAKIYPTALPAVPPAVLRAARLIGSGLGA